jgi:hypothetical protein
MASITSAEVQRAATELGHMRRSLTAWLKFRALNDRVLAGTAPVRRPLAYAQQVVAQSRDPRIEQDLATKLYALLSVVMPDHPLPDPDVSTHPDAAVALAQLAITGGTAMPGPVAAGNFLTAGPPWLWPALIVGAAFLVVTTAIKTSADVAKDHEEKACIMAGACTDYGFWLKAGGIAVLAWLAWEKMGIGAALTKKGRS